MHFGDIKILIQQLTRTRNNASRFVVVVNVESLYSNGNFESRLMKRRLCLLICIVDALNFLRRCVWFSRQDFGSLNADSHAHT